MKAFKSDAMRFTLPVIAENIFTTGVGLIYSAIVGGISASSLAAMGTGNQAINLVVALFAVITTGGVVLTAQLTGRSDIPRASRVVEHTLLLAPASALVITVVLLAVSAPLMRLLMPGAQADFVKESTDYFRMLLLSLPGLITMNALTGLLRASGESRIALLNSILINVVQIAAAYLFINRMGMKIMGAGCAYVACRYAGAIAMVIAVFGHHRGFRVEPSRIFRPSMPVVREILRVGLPTSVDSFSVQAGYLLNNSLLIGLGVRAASTYNVIATIVTFTGICQGIGNTSAATENVLFYDGKIHKLGEVKFEIPMDEDGFEDFMKPWVFTSDDNRFYMNFTPVLDRSAFMSAGVVLSDQHQVFGHFTGRITLDDGTVLPVRDFFGFAEKVENKW